MARAMRAYAVAVLAGVACWRTQSVAADAARVLAETMPTDSVIAVQVTKDSPGPTIVLVRTGLLQSDSARYRTQLQRRMLAIGWIRATEWRHREQSPLVIVQCCEDACDERADLSAIAVTRGYLFERGGR